MKITIHTSNCGPDNWYAIEELADSAIEIRMEFDTIVSVQSRASRKIEICAAIQDELSKFRWMATGNVNVEFCWYLQAVERQETDKVGDIDNISKPIIDALTGENGIIFDDSQIKSLHIFWLSRNENSPFNILNIRISIHNDNCIMKENLYFIQYAGPACLPINIDFSDHESVLIAFILLKGRQIQRAAAGRIRRLGGNVDRMLVASEWDIHRTRLSGFSKAKILSEKEFKPISFEKGFSWKTLRSMLKHR